MRSVHLGVLVRECAVCVAQVLKFFVDVAFLVVFAARCRPSSGVREWSSCQVPVIGSVVFWTSALLGMMISGLVWVVLLFELVSW